MIGPAPVIILASRGSGGSLLAALLGAHPRLYGAPHLNVLAFEYGWQQKLYCRPPRDSNQHGLLRFLGQSMFGEQSVQSIQAARRWFGTRSERNAAAIYAELAALVAPRRLVDYSPLYAQNRETIRRVCTAVPNAHIIHLVRNPAAQATTLSRAVWQSLKASLGYWAERGLNHPGMDAYEIGEQLVDWSSHPAVFDPQFAWYRTQKAAIDVLDALPRSRRIRLRLEDLQADPHGTLASLLRALEIEANSATIDAMLSSDGSEFSAPGPFDAPAGIDFDMIGRTVAEALRAQEPDGGIDATLPLPWRGDDDCFVTEVLEISTTLGYELR